MAFRSKEKPNHWKGFVTGALGGVAGTVVMGYYWQLVTQLAGKDPRTEVNDEGPHEFDSISLVGKQHEDDESSTMAMGRVLYKSLSGKEPQTKETKSVLSNVVHYSYGTLQGGLFGASRTKKTLTDISGGLGYGTGMWLFGDELGVSVVGFADGPTRFPVSQHLYRWGAHLVYGVTTATVARLLYRWF